MPEYTLTNTYYHEADRILVAVDCIIFGFDGDYLKLLLFKRKMEPYAGQWSLVGSFVKKNESLEQAADRILFELSGLKNVYLRQLHSYSEVNRDPGGRVISVSFYALIRLDSFDTEVVRQKGAQWFNIKDIPPLIFDHQQMVEMAHEELKNQARFQPIGLELLPPKFTLPQLHRLYEEIYQKKLDDRNFRKKIKNLRLLVQLKEKDKSNSRKGAYYHKFNRKRYHKLTSKGVVMAF